MTDTHHTVWLNRLLGHFFLLEENTLVEEENTAYTNNSSDIPCHYSCQIFCICTLISMYLCELIALKQEANKVQPLRFLVRNIL